VSPAIVLHPLPSQFTTVSGGRRRRRGRRRRPFEPAFIVELLGCDENEGFLEGPVTLAVFTSHGRRVRSWFRHGWLLLWNVA